mmetsp:Transcript_14377/g.42821  ORF Transcript_14377/g.42821 Transcript_14377/m.42821 type:complete len:103 (-) Transcript_14377:302-610(-)
MMAAAAPTRLPAPAWPLQALRAASVAKHAAKAAEELPSLVTGPRVLSGRSARRWAPALSSSASASGLERQMYASKLCTPASSRSRLTTRNKRMAKLMRTLVR